MTAFQRVEKRKFFEHGVTSRKEVRCSFLLPEAVRRYGERRKKGQVRIKLILKIKRIKHIATH